MLSLLAQNSPVQGLGSSLSSIRATRLASRPNRNYTTGSSSGAGNNGSTHTFKGAYSSTAAKSGSPNKNARPSKLSRMREDSKKKFSRPSSEEIFEGGSKPEDSVIKFPREREMNRRSVDQVRADREAMSSQRFGRAPGGRYGSSQSSSGGGGGGGRYGSSQSSGGGGGGRYGVLPSASATVKSSISKTVDLDGDDRVLNIRPDENKRRVAETFSQDKKEASRAAPKKEEVDVADESSLFVSRGAKLEDESERGELDSSAANEAGYARIVDADLKEADEEGEERLVSELDKEFNFEKKDTDTIPIRSSQREIRDTTPESGMAEELPELFKLSDHERNIPLKRALQEGTPRPITDEEAAAADSMEDILNPRDMLSPADRDAELALLDTPFPYSGPNEVALHSEMGLLQGVVDLFERIITEKQKQMLNRATKKKRWDIWKAQSWEKRAKLHEKKNARAEKLRKERFELLQKNKADPNMIYYPELDLYIPKDLLRNVVGRNAVSATVSNPTWDRARKRTFLIELQKDLQKIEAGPNPDQEYILNTLYSMGTPPKIDDTRAIEHLLKLPITDWGLMMAQAEKAMDHADRLKRFEPSPAELRGAKL